MVSARHITDLLQSQGFEDFVRPNFFEVEFHKVVSRGRFGIHRRPGNSTLVLTQDFVQKVNIPATNFGEVQIKRMGRKLLMPGELAFGDNLIIGMHSDDKGDTRAFFVDWMESYSRNPVEGKFNDIRKFLGSTVVVYALNGKLERRQKFVFQNVYPKGVIDIEFSHETDDQVMLFTVSFAYSIQQYSNEYGTGFADLERAPDSDPNTSRKDRSETAETAFKDIFGI